MFFSVLGWGSGGRTPIAEDLTFSEVTDIADVQDDLYFALDPYNENRCLLVYRDDGTYGNDTQVVCGNLAADGNSITWGTVVEYSPNYGDVGSVEFDPSTENSFIIIGRFRTSGNAHFHGARAGTISGTTITLGSEVNLSWCTADDYINNTQGMFNPAQAGQVIVVSGNYDGANGCSGGSHRQGELKVLTVSGTSITHVSNVIIEPDEFSKGTVEWDNVTANKGYIMYGGQATYPKIRPFTMSGNTVTLGTTHVTNSDSCGEHANGCVTSVGGQVVQIYKGDGSNAQNIEIVVGNDDSTAANGTITFGTKVNVYTTDGTAVLYPNVCADKNTPNKVLIGYNIPISGSSSRFMVGTITGDDTISVGSHVHAFASSGTPDIIKNVVNDPHNPGLFYSAHSHTGDSSKPKIVGHQVASFEL